jgi:hypothetical protein
MTVEEFIAKWQPSGGNERANTQLFISDLCALLEIEAPRPTLSATARNDYVFERHVVKTEIDGTTSNGWIDCYKRDSFILEAKQGSEADQKAIEAGQGDSLRDLFGQTAADRFKRGMAKRGTGQWTGAMQRAAGQAEGYAKALPADHAWPPFLLVTDVGYCIDVYADFQRNGKGYAPFPDRRRFRITLEDLRDEKVRDRLAALWDRPLTLDPSTEAARVTREIAGHLATLARRLESRAQNPDRVAAFLMRLLFTMFAEDTGLIPKKSFSALLRKVRDRPENLPPMLTDLWLKMDSGGFVGALGESGETVRQFNGYLFKETVALPLEIEEIDVLIAAASADWRQVEPAIFGTLLERALNSKERAKLGAHYTPRAYVERLVGPTIMEPLREDWAGARTAATQEAEAGDKEAARKTVEIFHGKLAQTRVLDPACGTGNFLYVAMARMKELEGEVLELLEELGDDQYLAEISGHTITPENFLGIEINPRAANIAQLVLWIGYLQWHFRVNGEDRMPEAPVLRDVKTIENRDALITWDKRELERDQYGKPVTRWDAETMKKHPVTGKDVPDETAQVEVYRYLKPKLAKWPKADFIIGNPPFFGLRNIREYLDEEYLQAVREVYDKAPGNIDFVLYWWLRSADALLKGGPIRFGFVTTKSISQSFARRLTRPYMRGKKPLRMAFAIPNHPWIDSADGADVRIAMTAWDVRTDPGHLAEVVDEKPEELGEFKVSLASSFGKINPRLQVNGDVDDAQSLAANREVCSVGYQIGGAGFFLNEDEVQEAALAGPTDIIRPNVAAAALVANRPRRFVVDASDLSEVAFSSQYPYLYQRVANSMVGASVGKAKDSSHKTWWRFQRPREDLRKAIKGLSRIVVRPLTSKHAIFRFGEPAVVYDSTCVVFALGDSYHFGVLQSRIHTCWFAENLGRLGVGDDPRYLKSDCFDPFPFPDISNETLKSRIRNAAEKLDALRKDVIARHEDLTLTKLYNVLEALRAVEKTGTVLSDKDRDIATRGCVSLIRQYHDTIDGAVAEAYGWPADLTDEEILERLVALNKERAAEEAKGRVRWLRPEFQRAGYVAPAEQKTLALPEQAKAVEVIAWPVGLPEQVVAVSGVVERAGKPIAANDVARAFKGKRAATVLPVLDALAGMGRLRKLEDGRYAA